MSALLSMNGILAYPKPFVMKEDNMSMAVQIKYLKFNIGFQGPFAKVQKPASIHRV